MIVFPMLSFVSQRASDMFESLHLNKERKHIKVDRSIPGSRPNL